MFMEYVGVSISVSIAIIMILLLSRVFGKRYTQKWKYYIWLIICIRLLIPYQIELVPIEINQSLFNIEALGTSDENMVPEKNSVNNLSGNTIKTVSNDSGEGTEIVNNVEMFDNEKSTTVVYNTIKENNQTIIYLQIIWLIGCVLYLSWSIVAYLLYKKQLLRWSYQVHDERTNKIWSELLRSLNIKKTVAVRKSSKAASPMVVGVVHPLLILPDTTLDEETLSYVMEHERVHIKRKDTLYKLLLLVVRAIHWFNPLVHVMYYEGCKSIEMTCDECVIAGKNISYCKGYTKAILETIVASSTRELMLTTSFSGSKKELKNRAFNIMQNSNKSKGILLTAICLFTIVMTTVACVKPITEEDNNIAQDTDFIVYNDSFTVSNVKWFTDLETMTNNKQFNKEEIIKSNDGVRYIEKEAISIYEKPYDIIYDFEQNKLKAIRYMYKYNTVDELMVAVKKFGADWYPVIDEPYIGKKEELEELPDYVNGAVGATWIATDNSSLRLVIVNQVEGEDKYGFVIEVMAPEESKAGDIKNAEATVKSILEAMAENDKETYYKYSWETFLNPNYDYSKNSEFGVISMEIQAVNYSGDSTNLIHKRYIGSEWAKDQGFSNEFLENNFVSVYYRYEATFDHTKTFLEDGIHEGHMYLLKVGDDWYLKDSDIRTKIEK